MKQNQSNRPQDQGQQHPQAGLDDDDLKPRRRAVERPNRANDGTDDDDLNRTSDEPAVTDSRKPGRNDLGR